jgi:hypothetical protein
MLAEKDILTRWCSRWPVFVLLVLARMQLVCRWRSS